MGKYVLVFGIMILYFGVMFLIYKNYGFTGITLVNGGMVFGMVIAALDRRI